MGDSEREKENVAKAHIYSGSLASIRGTAGGRLKQGEARVLLLAFLPRESTTTSKYYHVRPRTQYGSRPVLEVKGGGATCLDNLCDRLRPLKENATLAKKKEKTTSWRQGHGLMRRSLSSAIFSRRSRCYSLWMLHG